jgi:hypothetical protein
VSQPGLGGKNKSTRRSLSVSGSTVIGAVIVALATIAAAFIGGAYAGPKIGIVIAQPTVTITATVRPATTSQAGPNGSTGTQTSPGKVLSQKQGVQLTQGYQLSFIDPTLRPLSYSSCGGDLAVCYGGDVRSAAQLAVYDGSAGFSQCQADTDYVASSANYTAQGVVSLADKTLCVTTGHRIAACYVTNDTTQAGIAAPGLTMNITVYASK